MEEKKSKITSLIVLLVFCIFAMCILLVLLTGAEVYKRLVERDQMQFDNRTVARYVTTRLRQSDRAGAVRVEDFKGQSALVFSEEIGGSFYETRVYCYDGYIRELFTTAGADFDPEDGEKILEAAKLEFCSEGTNVTVEITLRDGTEQELFLHLRSSEEDWSGEK